MNIVLTGHDYKYAAEQLLLTLFPQQRPVYDIPAPGEDGVELVRSPDGSNFFCRLTLNGAAYERREAVLPWRDETERVRNEQRALKMSFYYAALSAGIKKPVWGALTGVKPGKLMARYLTEGRTEEDFIRDFDVDPDRARLCRRTTGHTLAAKASLASGDIGLYVGIPFCPTRCAYCSFISSAVGANEKLMAPYLDALCIEIEQTAQLLRDEGLRPVSLYFGGGTPTTLSAAQLDRLCGTLAKHIDLSALREYTVEAGRPDTITAEKLAVLKQYGVSRVSVNPQTMSDTVLQAIGRFHTAQDIVDALALVRAAGGFQVNMDLIAGLPKDTEAGFSETLSRVLALAPENITVHTLAIKRGSRLAADPGVLPAGEAVGQMVNQASRRLDAAGYEPYYLYRQKYMSGGFENVGWAKPGTVNLYNILMMEELCPVIAMGAGGSTKLIAPSGLVQRKLNPKYPKEYIERICGETK